MKKSLAWLIIASALFLSCFAAFAQKTPAQFKTDIYNNIRTQPYGTTRAGDAFDAAVNASKSFYIDGTASGTNTYAVTVSNYAMTSYVTGQSFRIQVTNANSSGTITLNVTPSASAANPSPTALGAIAVKGNDGNNLAVGDIKAGGVYDFFYNGTNFRCTNVGGSSSGGISQRYSFPPAIYTANHTLSFADTIKTIVMDATGGDLELHVPADATTDFSHGQLMPIIFFGNNDLTVVSDGASHVSSTSGSLVIAASADTVYLTIQKYNTNTWLLAAPSAGGGGAGDVTKVGTPANNQIAVWTGDGTLEGTSGLTYDGSNWQLTGDIGSTGSRITKGWFTDLQVTNAIAGSITGNAATVTTNANLTGDVTSVGNATTLATVTVPKGGTGATTITGLLQGNGTSAVTGITNSTTVGQALRVTGSNTYAWGALDVADADAVTGVLPIANGGLNSSSAAFTSLTDGTTVTWNAANQRLPNASLSSTQSFTFDITNTVDGSTGSLELTIATTSAITVSFDVSPYTNKRTGAAGEETFTTHSFDAGASGRQYMLSWQLVGTNMHWYIGDITPVTQTPYAKVQRIATQSTLTATLTTISWDTENTDNAAIWSVANASRYTIPGTGDKIAVFNVSIKWDVNSTGLRRIQILKNGSLVAIEDGGFHQATGVTTVNTFIHTMFQIECTAGDYIEVQAYQNSGSTISFTAGSSIHILDR